MSNVEFTVYLGLGVNGPLSLSAGMIKLTKRKDILSPFGMGNGKNMKKISLKRRFYEHFYVSPLSLGYSCIFTAAGNTVL